MRDDVRRDFNYSARFVDHAMDILGRVLQRGRVATEREDLKQATDFVLMPFNGGAAALRVRRHWARLYAGEITIRAHRPSGTETEVDKILEGHGDYMVYGWGIWNGRDRMCSWAVIDLDRLRLRLPALLSPGGGETTCPSGSPTETDRPTFWP